MLSVLPMPASYHRELEESTEHRSTTTGRQRGNYRGSFNTLMFRLGVGQSFVSKIFKILYFFVRPYLIFCTRPFAPLLGPLHAMVVFPTRTLLWSLWSLSFLSFLATSFLAVFWHDSYLHRLTHPYILYPPRPRAAAPTITTRIVLLTNDKIM